MGCWGYKALHSSREDSQGWRMETMVLAVLILTRHMCGLIGDLTLGRQSADTDILNEVGEWYSVIDLWKNLKT